MHKPDPISQLILVSRSGTALWPDLGRPLRRRGLESLRALGLLLGFSLGLLAFPGLGPTASTATAQDFSRDDIAGVWLTDEGRFRVAVAACPSAEVETDESEDRPIEYCGTILWARAFTEEEQKEFGSDDEPFDPQKAIGTTILRGFVHNGEDRWEDGEFLLESRDKSYGATLRLREADDLDVTIRAAWIFRKTVRWTRWNGEASPQDSTSVDRALPRGPG